MSEALIHNLKFDERGLITAIVQDQGTQEVLMVAYMNAESLAKTLQTGETWFWSRSRQELWHKGETSGNTQRVIDVRLDCDGDAVLIRVEPRGPACHTGQRTCFYRATGGAPEPIPPTPIPEDRPEVKVEPVSSPLSVVSVTAMDLGILLQNLYQLIQERQDQRPEGSYTSYLFNSGLDKILKKIGEESAETIIAAKNADLSEGRKQLSGEISDLLYHLLVLMVERQLSLQDILNELNERAGKPANPKYGS
ncbi:MAG TPA: bifunctional phosphoribosyl-AMP cyclohydrolase/phosphoribosyl-ATP diphosphatase HisIE [Blastocatellia bacterium]|nr:bifunctional phosphoribosyl-AMP cyclohydrolase/phosphoribosyl-ATP diphosphatase HisIE [Blastocatellia bacterium]